MAQVLDLCVLALDALNPYLKYLLKALESLLLRLQIGSFMATIISIALFGLQFFLRLNFS